jgi:DNA processing protein
MVERGKLRAYLRLHLADGVGAVAFRRLTDAFGSVEAACAADPSRWRQVEGVGEKTAQAMAAVTDGQVDEELSVAKKAGVEVLCLEDECYPAALKTIYDPPPVLYVRGRLEPEDAIAIAVVGARRCTHYGREQAERFGQLLGRAGFTVVSGGARGIDVAAHEGALRVGGRTIAVMGCGLCHTYPPEHARLFERIVADDRGAVASELPMRTAVLPGNFPTRNRIISGLSLGTLVVEATRRSGSLITARLANEQGRCVFATPGRADSPLSQGTHRLIRDGATLVQGLEDILEQLGAVGEGMRPDEDEPQTAQAIPPALDATEARILSLLRDGPMCLDDLARRAGLESGKAASAMTMLVIKGAVDQHPGNVFARRS